MLDLLKSRVTAIWLILVTATLASLLLFERFSSTAAERYVSAAVLVIAFIKVRFVGREFMDLRHAPWGLRLGFEAWVWVMAAALVAIRWRSG